MDMIKDCHVGVKGIICINDECLVLQKGVGDNAYWDIPGGRIDEGETLHATLTRELHEELPCIKEFSILDVVGAYRLDRDLEGGQGLVLIFYQVTAEPFDMVLSPEHTDYKWVRKETLPELHDSTVSIKPELYSILEKILG